jgi:hypothetical protein
MRDPRLRPLMFQIGPNKCATTALYKLFDRSGVPSLHNRGRKYMRQKHQEIAEVNPQRRIYDNILRGVPPLDGLDSFSGFFDMEWANAEFLIENYKYFVKFAETYPNSKFILNTRNRNSWLQSKALHRDGLHLAAACERHGKTALEVISMWENDIDVHTKAVRRYFLDQPERLLEFDVAKEPIEKLINFAEPEFDLDPSKWRRVNATNNARDVALYDDMIAKMMAPALSDQSEVMIDARQGAVLSKMLRAKTEAGRSSV